MVFELCKSFDARKSCSGLPCDPTAPATLLGTFDCGFKQSTSDNQPESVVWVSLGGLDSATVVHSSAEAVCFRMAVLRLCVGIRSDAYGVLDRHKDANTGDADVDFAVCFRMV